MIQLINARPSPFGRKVAIALLEKNVPFETIWDEPWGDQTIVARHNPLAQLPILITDNGEAIYESTFILEWIERRFPNPPLLPADDDGILAAKKLMVLAEGVMNAAASVGHELHKPSPSDPWIARQRHKIVAASETIAAAVEGQEFAIRNTFGQADLGICSTFTAMDFTSAAFGFAFEEMPWRSRLPGLADYVDRLERRSSFIATRPSRMQLDLKSLH